MWAQIINTLLGLWIMISPYILNFDEEKLADLNFIAGPVIISFAVISYWQVTRAVRKWNIGIAGLLILLSFFSDSNTGIFSNIIACILIIIFSMIKGKITHRFGGGWAALFE